MDHVHLFEVLGYAMKYELNGIFLLISVYFTCFKCVLLFSFGVS